MTRTQLKQTVYAAFFRIVRMQAPPSLPAFYHRSISETLPDNMVNPSGWPDFWWESVAVEIQNGVMARGEFISNFDAAWLKKNKNQPWKRLVEFADDEANLVPLRLG